MTKRGQQTIWLPTVVHVLLSMVLLIIGLLIINRFASGFDTTIEFKTQDLDHSLLSARLLNSPDCLAWTESYTKAGQTQYIVHSGIIDMQKFDKSRISNCIKGKNFDLKLYELGASESKQKASGDVKDALMDTFLVRVYDSGKFSTQLITIQIK